MLGFNPTALIAVLIGTAAVSGTAYFKGRSDGEAAAVRNYADRFMIILSNEQQESRAYVAGLWNQIGHERQSAREQIDGCLAGMAATGAARARFEARLREQGAELARLENEATEMLNRLEAEQDEWKADPIPDAISCGVLRGRGCPAAGVQPAASGTGPDPDMGVREPAAGNLAADELP